MRLTQLLKMAGVVVRNLVLGTNLISLRLLTTPRQMIYYVSENLFLYQTLNSKRGIPQKNVCEVLPSQDLETITLGSLRSGKTWFFNYSSFASDIINLCLLAQIIKPEVVFEIGTYEGYTAFQLALNSPAVARIYTLDLPKEAASGPKLSTTAVDREKIEEYLSPKEYLFHGSKAADKIVCLYGDSADFDFSSFHQKVDLFFIDGAHSYEYVKSDTQNALQCCHPGSVIAWHDFGRIGINGVFRFILELAKDHEIYSVPGGSLAFMVVK